MTKISTKPFDPVAFLQTPEDIAEYLNAAAEDPNPNVFLSALLDAAKARGVQETAEKAGIARESLYKALRAGSEPRYSTVMSIVQSFGLTTHYSSDVVSRQHHVFHSHTKAYGTRDEAIAAARELAVKGMKDNDVPSVRRRPASKKRPSATA